MRLGNLHGYGLKVSCNQYTAKTFLPEGMDFSRVPESDLRSFDRESFYLRLSGDAGSLYTFYTLLIRTEEGSEFVTSLLASLIEAHKDSMAGLVASKGLFVTLYKVCALGCGKEDSLGQMNCKEGVFLYEHEGKQYPILVDTSPDHNVDYNRSVSYWLHAYYPGSEWDEQGKALLNNQLDQMNLKVLDMGLQPSKP